MLHCKRKSDRDFPILNTFTFALTKGKIHYNANEKYARIFALYLFTMTTFGWNFVMNKSKKSKDTIYLVIHALEMTLTIYQFLYEDKVDMKCHSKVRKHQHHLNEVMKYMKIIRKILVNGTHLDKDVDPCQFPKFHYLKHIFPMIKKFGSARNFDGGPCESNHKYLSKQPGSRTQKRMDVFDEQTSYNLASKIVLERSCRDAGVMHGSAGGSFREQVIMEKQKDTVTINEKSAKFQLLA